MYIKMKSDIYICVYSFVPLVFNLFPFRLQIGRTSISILWYLVTFHFCGVRVGQY